MTDRLWTRYDWIKLPCAWCLEPTTARANGVPCCRDCWISGPPRLRQSNNALPLGDAEAHDGPVTGGGADAFADGGRTLDTYGFGDMA